MVATTVDTFGRLDMAFNDAGIQLPVCDAEALLWPKAAHRCAAADKRAEAFDRATAIWLCISAPAS